MMTEVGQPLHKKIMDFGTWRYFAYHKSLSVKVLPQEIVLSCEFMSFRQNAKNSLRPQRHSFTSTPISSTCKECHIDSKLTHCSYMFVGVSFYKFNLHIFMD